MVPAANGRLLVRSTLASKSLSHRSFTVHPAPRSRSAPAPNSARSLASGRAPEGAARAMDQKHGQAKSQVPAGNRFQSAGCYDLSCQKTRLVKHCACQAGPVGQMHAPMGAWRRMSCAYGSIYFGSILSSRFLLSLCVFFSMTALGTGRPSAPFSAVVLSSLVNVTCTMGTCEMNAFY